MAIESINRMLTTIADNMKYVYERGLKEGAGEYGISLGYTGSYEKIITQDNVNYALENKNLSKEDVQVVSCVEDIVKIDNGAFSDLSNVRVAIPLYRENKIKAVGDRAFENCSSLKELDLRNCTQLGANFVKGCTSLKNLWLSKNVPASILRDALNTAEECVFKEYTKDNVTYRHIGTCDGEPVYVREITKSLLCKTFNPPDTVKCVEKELPKYFADITLDYDKIDYPDEVLKNYTNATINSLTVVNLKVSHLAQLCDSSYTYQNDASVISPKALYLYNSGVKTNALRGLKYSEHMTRSGIQELHLNNCTLGVNCCAYTDINDLYLNSLQDVKTNSFRGCDVRNIEVSGGKYYTKPEYDNENRGLYTVVEYKYDGMTYYNEHFELLIPSKNLTEYTIHFDEWDSEISDNAIYDIESLEVLNIENVSAINGRFLHRCYNVRKVNIYNSGSAIYIDGGIIYNNLYECIRRIPAANSTLTIRDGTKSIRQYAFSNISYDDTITIPKSVTYISPSAFEEARIKTLKVPAGSLYNQAVSTKCFGAKSYTSIQSY